MLARRLRRRPNIKSALVERSLFAYKRTAEHDVSVS